MGLRSYSNDRMWGRKSTRNSTSETLANGASWTGQWELNRWPDGLFTGFCDVELSVSLQFSPDASNVDSSLSFTATGSIYEIHRLVKGVRYCRVVLTNNSGTDASELRFLTSFGSYGPLTAPMDLVVGTDADTLVVRPTGHDLDLAQGRFAGQSVIGKFGENDAVGTSEEDIWAQGGLYTGFLTTAATVRIKAGGSADDAAAGTGAQQVIIEGLDENFAVATETLATNGASVSSATTTTFIRVYRAYIGNVGTYHGANAGNIELETSGGTTVSYIPTGLGQTQLAIYTIPAGKTGYLTRLWTDLDGSKAATIRYWRNENADDVSTPFTGKRIIRNFPGVSGSFQKMLSQYVVLPAKTDVWMSAIGPSGGTGVAGGFDIILVDD